VVRLSGDVSLRVRVRVRVRLPPPNVVRLSGDVSLERGMAAIRARIVTKNRMRREPSER